MNSHVSYAVGRGCWVSRAQNVAVFTACANLFSTALANVGLALFLAIVLYICLTSARRDLAWRQIPRCLLLGIGAYLAWRLVGILYTSATSTEAWASLYSDRKILWVFPLLLLFDSEPPRRRFLTFFLATCAIALAISFGSLIPLVRQHIGVEPASVLRSHATQGIAFAMAAFIALWFFGQAATLKARLALLTLAILFTANILTVTFGRSGYFAFLVFIVAAFARRGSFKGAVIGVTAAGAVAVLAFQLSPPVRERVVAGIDEARNYQEAPVETSLGRRMVLLNVSVYIIQQAPVLGAGTGSFPSVFSENVARRYTGWMARPFDDPHNQYLHSLSENGIVGLGTLLFMLWTMWHSCDRRHIYGQMAAACLLAWGATSLFSSHFRTFPEGHMIAFTLGMLMMPIRYNRSHQFAR